MNRSRLWDLAVVAFCLSIFLALSLHQLDLPGLYHDEAADAVPAMQLVQGQKVELVNDLGLVVGNRTLPVMAMDYVGAVSTYLLVPFFAFFGVGVLPMRTMTVLAAALTILLAYLFAKNLFNRPVAVITAALLAVNPSFIFWSRQGIHVSSVVTALAMGSLLSFLRWHRNGQVAFFFLGTLLLGIGLSTKILFLWVILALGVSYFVFAPRRTLGLKAKCPSVHESARNSLPPASSSASRPPATVGGEGFGTHDDMTPIVYHDPPLSQEMATKAVFTYPTARIGDNSVESDIAPPRSAWSHRNGTSQPVAVKEPEPVSPEAHRFPLPFGLLWFQLPVALVLFALGAWMIILYNVRTQGTLKVLFGNLRTTERGVNNLAFLDNLGTQLVAFATLLKGDHFWFLGGWFANDLYVSVFVASIIVLALLLLMAGPARPFARRVGFVGLFVALILAQSCFTVSILGPTHLLVLLPLPQLLIAVALYLLWRSLPWPRLILIAGTILILAVLAVDVSVDLQYHRVLRETGGWLNHSDAVYRLADYLGQRGIDKPIIMDWGIKPSVQILTKGKIEPVEIFQYSPEPNETFLNWLYGALTKSPDTIYVFHTDDATTFPRYQAFLDLVAKLDKHAGLEWTVRQRDGRVIFNIYSVQQNSK